jgi:conjugal transfer/type IV secretion protein DotA/TraY
MTEMTNAKPAYQITAKSVAKYALLPGIMPRLKRLGFAVSRFLFVFTQFFGTIGLIEKNHPCLNAENIGYYRFSHIVAYAYSNLRFNRKNIPQICLFAAAILALVLMVGICIAFVANLFLQFSTAHAQYFGYPDQNGWTRDSDWAFRFLERIFGTETGPNFWREAKTGGAANPWFTLMFVGMLKHYSYALLVIAAFMVIYLIVITLAESAKTGQPFGTRFDSVWAPIRLAMAVGLLIPIAGPGYNMGQLITFQVAEWGSNMATNLWFGAINTVKDSKFFASNVSDPGYRFVRDMFLINMCVEGYARVGKQSGGMFTKMQKWESTSGGMRHYMYGPAIAPTWCGHVTVPDTAFMNNQQKAEKRKPSDAPPVSTYWPFQITTAYKNIADNFLPVEKNGKVEPGPAMKQYVADFVDAELGSSDKNLAQVHDYQPIAKWVQDYWGPLERPWGEDTAFFTGQKFGGQNGYIARYNTWLVDSLQKDSRFGWASAGVFYLRMSNAMSLVSDAIDKSPKVTKLPTNITRRYATPLEPKLDEEGFRDRCEGWFSWWPTGSCSSLSDTVQFSKFLKNGLNWLQTIPASSPTTYANLGGNYYNNAVLMPEADSPENTSTDMVMGSATQSLYDRIKINSQDLHPLGAVISWGNSLMAGSATAYGLAMLVGIVSFGGAKIFKSIGDVLLIPGFILAFLVPMLPFLYFMFAVIEWMISIMEAVISMPLWALSFISLEGDFLGKGMEGVKRLFEIMLRPSIIIIALVTAVLVFSASIAFFNDSMDLFMRGYSSGTKGELSFGSDMVASIAMILIYMFGVYSLATASFKLIDVIPDQFGRWMGLPQGFGSQIRTGIDAITGAIIGAGVAKAVMGMGDRGLASAQGARDQARQGMRTQAESNSAAANKASADATQQAQHSEQMNALNDIKNSV